MKREIKSIIFDFDGVLVNTEYTTFCFYREILPSYGFYLKERDFKYKIGRKSIDFFKDIMKEKFDPQLVGKLIDMKRKAFHKNVKRYLKPVPGGFEFLKKTKERGFITALASQNEKILIEKAVGVFNIRKYFNIILSIQDISHKKPHPELYIKAADRLGISPSEGIVFEDTIEGIIAAKRGNFKVICITTSFSKEDLSGADLIIDSFDDVDLQNIDRI